MQLASDPRNQEFRWTSASAERRLLDAEQAESFLGGRILRNDLPVPPGRPVEPAPLAGR